MNLHQHGSSGREVDEGSSSAIWERQASKRLLYIRRAEFLTTDAVQAVLKTHSRTAVLMLHLSLREEAGGSKSRRGDGSSAESEAVLRAALVKQATERLYNADFGQSFTSTLQRSSRQETARAPSIAPSPLPCGNAAKPGSRAIGVLGRGVIVNKKTALASSWIESVSERLFGEDSPHHFSFGVSTATQCCHCDRFP